MRWWGKPVASENNQWRQPPTCCYNELVTTYLETALKCMVTTEPFSRGRRIWSRCKHSCQSHSIYGNNRSRSLIVTVPLLKAASVFQSSESTIKTRNWYMTRSTRIGGNAVELRGLVICCPILWLLKTSIRQDLNCENYDFTNRECTMSSVVANVLSTT